VLRATHLNGARPCPLPRQTFKLSTDPRFFEKFTDVVGLYVDPPAHAVVLSVDEKSQIQAAQPHPARAADEEGARQH
jgi:hypothetical protein